MGIGPTQPAWKAGALPLSYTRIFQPSYYIKPFLYCQQKLIFFLKELI